MRINEIFYSIQGEGRWAGTPSVFVRFAGCNLACPFCDTDHAAFSEMSEEEITGRVKSFCCRRVVVTGGEPALQLTQSLIDRLHNAGCYIQVETNGSVPLPGGIDWVTCSPKSAPVVLDHIDELKVVLGEGTCDMTLFDHIVAQERRVQPCDVGDAARNRAILDSAICFVLENPGWSLSLQTHKLIGIR